jgi:hypothetical protein
MSNHYPPAEFPSKRAFGCEEARAKRLLDSDDDDEERNIVIFTKESPLPKTITLSKKPHITESKILGTAPTRRPRIGPEYQAELPPLPPPKRPGSKHP